MLSIVALRVLFIERGMTTANSSATSMTSVAMLSAEVAYHQCALFIHLELDGSHGWASEHWKDATSTADTSQSRMVAPRVRMMVWWRFEGVRFQMKAAIESLEKARAKKKRIREAYSAFDCEHNKPPE